MSSGVVQASELRCSLKCLKRHWLHNTWMTETQQVSTTSAVGYELFPSACSLGTKKGGLPPSIFSAIQQKTQDFIEITLCPEVFHPDTPNTQCEIYLPACSYRHVSIRFSIIQCPSRGRQMSAREESQKWSKCAVTAFPPLSYLNL